MAPRGTVNALKRYSLNTSDVTGCDIYPFWSPTFSDLPNKTLSCVGEYTARMARAVEGNEKPILMMLEGGTRRRGGIPWRTIRFETYDAIINGARGISFYWDGEFHNDEDNAWPAVGRVTREIKGIEPALTAARDRSRGKLEFGTIEALHLNDGEYDYWLCANRGEELANLALDKLTADIESLEVLFEVRSTDRTEFFEPYEVHVYTNNPHEIRPVGKRLLPKGVHSPPALNMASLEKGVFSFEHWKAKWIWSKEFEGKAPVTLYFRKKFTLENEPESAWLATYMDDGEALYINGRLVTRGSYQNLVATSHDVLSFLNKGTNVIAAKVRDKNIWISGFLLEAGIRTEGGSVELVSDASWRVTSESAEGWEEEPFDDSQWENAAAYTRPPIAVNGKKRYLSIRALK